jgi:hypothetical protein
MREAARLGRGTFTYIGNDAGLTTHALATNLPHGWQYEAVFGLGQGATAGPLHLLVGLAALLLAAGLGVARRRDVALAVVRRRHGR